MEPLAVAAAIVLASLYLLLRPVWLRRDGKKRASGCGGGCSCGKEPKIPR